MFEVHQLNVKNKSVLDVGCGSGILAIAANKLGASKITAFDVDEVAMENCYENLEINDSKNIDAFAGSIEKIKFESDIVIANIISSVLISLKNELNRCLKPGGKLILSGVLVTEKDQLISEFSHLKLISESEKGEWSSFVFEK